MAKKSKGGLQTPTERPIKVGAAKPMIVGKRKSSSKR